MQNKREQQGGLSAMENTAIVVTVLLLLLFAAKRLENSVYLQNIERATRELYRIHQLERAYYLENGTYEHAEEVGFKLSYPYSGIIYSTKIDDNNFMAYAVEVVGHDAFGDKKAGNEYISIDAEGEIVRQSFAAELTE